MTTPDNKPETPQETPETASDARTFMDMYGDIQDQCDCVTELSAKDDTTTEFTRCVGAKPCDANWFRSFKEMNTKLRKPLETWTDQCKFRGVSINKLAGNREEIKAAYTAMKLVSPKAGVIVEGKYVCTFRMTLKAGKVADTPNRRPVGHYTLLKCDGFDISCLAIIGTVSIEEF